MIDIKEINHQIKILEDYKGSMNFSLYNKLAILYIIKDHYENKSATTAAEVLAKAIEKETK